MPISGPLGFSSSSSAESPPRAPSSPMVLRFPRRRPPRARLLRGTPQNPGCAPPSKFPTLPACPLPPGLCSQPRRCEVLVEGGLVAYSCLAWGRWNRGGCGWLTSGRRNGGQLHRRAGTRKAPPGRGTVGVRVGKVSNNDKAWEAMRVGSRRRWSLPPSTPGRKHISSLERA